MGPNDRDYFMLRARQERRAVICSTGEVRRRHEELACAYEMRVVYIDRGLIGTDSAPPGLEQPDPMTHFILA
jgi:hypothetical protein